MLAGPIVHLPRTLVTNREIEMKATIQNQRIAREFAERHDSGYDARARQIRAENERRTAVANRSRVRTLQPLQWLDDATRSVPAYEVLS